MPISNSYIYGMQSSVRDSYMNLVRNFSRFLLIVNASLLWKVIINENERNTNWPKYKKVVEIEGKKWLYDCVVYLKVLACN